MSLLTGWTITRGTFLANVSIYWAHGVRTFPLRHDSLSNLCTSLISKRLYINSYFTLAKWTRLAWQYLTAHDGNLVHRNQRHSDCRLVVFMLPGVALLAYDNFWLFIYADKGFRNTVQENKPEKAEFNFFVWQSDQAALDWILFPVFLWTLIGGSSQSMLLQKISMPSVSASFVWNCRWPNWLLFKCGSSSTSPVSLTWLFYPTKSLMVIISVQGINAHACPCEALCAMNKFKVWIIIFFCLQKLQCVPEDYAVGF